MNADKVLIIGAGHQGLAMAAHMESCGIDCYLWNRTEKNILDIKKNNIIRCKGIINKAVKVKVVTSNIKEALQKFIMIATPSSAHIDIAQLLAKYVDDTYTIILNPGRTFGILEFILELKKAGCKKLPLVAEAQTIIYTCRRDSTNNVHIFALKNDVPISSLNIERTLCVLDKMPVCIKKYFKVANNFYETSLGNVGMILHCAPVLMNIGWIESRITNFEYYYDGISPTIATFLEKMDNERLEVANAINISIESTVEWLKRTYDTNGINLFEHLQSNIYYKGIDAPQTIQHRYIQEDVPNGLVPLESMAKELKIETPYISSIITLANNVMNIDYRRYGRNFKILKQVLEDE